MGKKICLLGLIVCVVFFGRREYLLYMKSNDNLVFRIVLGSNSYSLYEDEEIELIQSFWGKYKEDNDFFQTRRIQIVLNAIDSSSPEYSIWLKRYLDQKPSISELIQHFSKKNIVEMPLGEKRNQNRFELMCYEMAVHHGFDMKFFDDKYGEIKTFTKHRDFFVFLSERRVLSEFLVADILGQLKNGTCWSDVVIKSPEELKKMSN